MVQSDKQYINPYIKTIISHFDALGASGLHGLLQVELYIFLPLIPG
jgi:hypothetical protein